MSSAMWLVVREMARSRWKRCSLEISLAGSLIRPMSFLPVICSGTCGPYVSWIDRRQTIVMWRRILIQGAALLLWAGCRRCAGRDVVSGGRGWCVAGPYFAGSRVMSGSRACAGGRVIRGEALCPAAVSCRAAALCRTVFDGEPRCAGRDVAPGRAAALCRVVMLCRAAAVGAWPGRILPAAALCAGRVMPVAADKPRRYFLGV